MGGCRANIERSIGSLILNVQFSEIEISNFSLINRPVIGLYIDNFVMKNTSYFIILIQIRDNDYTNYG